MLLALLPVVPVVELPTLLKPVLGSPSKVPEPVLEKLPMAPEPVLEKSPTALEPVLEKPATLLPVDAPAEPLSLV